MFTDSEPKQFFYQPPTPLLMPKDSDFPSCHLTSATSPAKGWDTWHAPVMDAIQHTFWPRNAKASHFPTEALLHHIPWSVFLERIDNGVSFYHICLGPRIQDPDNLLSTMTEKPAAVNNLAGITNKGEIFPACDVIDGTITLSYPLIISDKPLLCIDNHGFQVHRAVAEILVTKKGNPRFDCFPTEISFTDSNDQERLLSFNLGLAWQSGALGRISRLVTNYYEAPQPIEDLVEQVSTIASPFIEITNYT